MEARPNIELAQATNKYLYATNIGGVDIAVRNDEIFRGGQGAIYPCEQVWSVIEYPDDISQLTQTENAIQSEGIPMLAKVSAKGFSKQELNYLLGLDQEAAEVQGLDYKDFSFAEYVTHYSGDRLQRKGFNDRARQFVTEQQEFVDDNGGVVRHPDILNEAMLLATEAQEDPSLEPVLVDLRFMQIAPDTYRPIMFLKKLAGVSLETEFSSWSELSENDLHKRQVSTLKSIAKLAGKLAQRSNKINSRDLKPSNIIVNETEAGNLDLRRIDLGLGAYKDAGYFLPEGLAVGTGEYTGHETYLGEQGDYQNLDQTALSITSLRVLTGGIYPGIHSGFSEQFPTYSQANLDRFKENTILNLGLGLDLDLRQEITDFALIDLNFSEGARHLDATVVPAVLSTLLESYYAGDQEGFYFARALMRYASSDFMTDMQQGSMYELLLQNDGLTREVAKLMSIKGWKRQDINTIASRVMTKLDTNSAGQPKFSVEYTGTTTDLADIELFSEEDGSETKELPVAPPIKPQSVA